MKAWCRYFNRYLHDHGNGDGAPMLMLVFRAVRILGTAGASYVQIQQKGLYTHLHGHCTQTGWQSLYGILGGKKLRDVTQVNTGLFFLCFFCCEVAHVCGLRIRIILVWNCCKTFSHLCCYSCSKPNKGVWEFVPPRMVKLPKLSVNLSLDRFIFFFSFLARARGKFVSL